MEAIVLLGRCKDRRLFGMSAYKTPYGDWERRWAFPIDEKRAHNEGYDRQQIQGSLNAAADYPGCPYCHNSGFVICGSCGHYTCYSGETSLYCAWCSKLMDNIQPASQFTVSGGDV